jgi:hypothetical protein
MKAKKAHERKLKSTRKEAKTKGKLLKKYTIGKPPMEIKKHNK